MFNFPFMPTMPMPVFENEDGTGTPSAVSGAGTGDDTVVAGDGNDTVTGGDDTVAGGDETVEGGDESDETLDEPLTLENITLPEGFEIPEAAQEEFVGLLNNADMSKAELVSKLMEMQAAQAVTSAEALQEAVQQQFNDTQAEWSESLKAWPKLGGERLDQSLSEVKTGLELAGATQEVFDALDVTGAGNHPALVPLLHKLTEQYREAAPVTTDPPQGKLTREQRMYPTMNKE